MCLIHLQNKAMIFQFINHFVNGASMNAFFQKVGLFITKNPWWYPCREQYPSPSLLRVRYQQGDVSFFPIATTSSESLDSVPHLASTQESPACRLKISKALGKKQNQSPSGIPVLPMNFLCTSVPSPSFQRYFTASSLLS